MTLSFDPARDSPAVMKHYAGSQLEEEGGVRWYFLTTRSVADLLPLVEGFGQDVRYSVDRSSGRPVRQLSHVLKVFLIDRVRRTSARSTLRRSCTRRRSWATSRHC